MYLKCHWLHACAFTGRTWDGSHGQNRKPREAKRTVRACAWLCYLIAHWKCLHCHTHTYTHTRTLCCGQILKNGFGKTSWTIDYTPNGPTLQKVPCGVKNFHLIGTHISAYIWLVHIPHLLSEWCTYLSLRLIKNVTAWANSLHLIRTHVYIPQLVSDWWTYAYFCQFDLMSSLFYKCILYTVFH